MAVDRIVTLAMIEDHHLTITGKPVGINHPALFDRADRLSRCRIDINSLTDDLSGKFGMFELAERRGDNAAYRPVKLSAISIETGAGRRCGTAFMRFGHRPTGDV